MFRDNYGLLMDMVCRHLDYPGQEERDLSQMTRQQAEIIIPGYMSERFHIQFHFSDYDFRLIMDKALFTGRNSMENFISGLEYELEQKYLKNIQSKTIELDPDRYEIRISI